MYKRFPKEATIYTPDLEMLYTDDYEWNDLYATDALYSFEHKRPVIGEGAGGVRIPFHAIDHVTVKTSVEEYDKANPYGCEASDPNGLTTENGTDITDENGNQLIAG